jgi:dihydrofolate synthase / folylpolyglutamate synthase
MPASYQQAVTQLLELGHELHQTPVHKFELENMRVLLSALRHPERRFPSVLVAGTNGKGSTSAMLASILQEAGYRTGLYTSPHLIRVNERIRINGEEISDVEFSEIHARIEEVAVPLIARGQLPGHPSFFEMLTAMAFEYFASAAVELAVLEVGMGGRLDATNVVDPVVAVITDIALDHQNFLGNTITEIAAEKAGIIKPGAVVVTLPQHPEASDVIGKTVLERNAHAISAAEYIPNLSPAAEELVSPRNSQPETRNCFYMRYPLTVLGEQMEISSPLIGPHQARNVALAIAAALELRNFGFNITAPAITSGIRQTSWPGRFQVVPAAAGFPECVLDVAHNPAGAWALRSTLARAYSERPLTFVFGAMRDKAIGEIAEILFPLAERVIATHAKSPRAATPEQIYELAAHTGAEIECLPNVQSALQRARDVSPGDGVIVVTGSIYVVGEALELLNLKQGETR